MAYHKLSGALLILLFCITIPVHCGVYKMLAEAMLQQIVGGWGGGGGGGWNSGWESKGVTLGLKSKGMTAIIPIPLPVPVFTKDKGGGGGGSSGGGGGSSGGGGEKVKYIPVPVPHGGGKEDWW